MIPPRCFTHSDPTKRGGCQLFIWVVALPSTHCPTLFPWAMVCFHGQLTIGVGMALPSCKTPSSSPKPNKTFAGLHVGLKLPATQHQMALLLIVVAGSSFLPATTVALTPGFSALPLSSTKIHGYRHTFLGCTTPTAP